LTIIPHLLQSINLYLYRATKAHSS